MSRPAFVPAMVEVKARAFARWACGHLGVGTLSCARGKSPELLGTPAGLSVDFSVHSLFVVSLARMTASCQDNCNQTARPPANNTLRMIDI